MRGDISGRLSAAERKRFEAAIVDETTPGYLAVRALIALGDETIERLAHTTASGRQLVVAVRRRVAEGKIAGLLTEKPTTAERILETATAQILAAGRSEVAIGTVAAAVGIPRRSLYRLYAPSELIQACQRRAMTIWRARFERRIQQAEATAVERLFLVVDDIAAWVGSERFHADQVLRPASVMDVRGNELREHLTAIVLFATGLAQEAHVAEPRSFGTFVAINVVGASAWIDRRTEAYSLAIAFVERLTGAPRPA
jgi:AcrR family transcriptional regulator